MRFKKMVSMLLAASMCAGALSGCAGSSKGGSETTAQQETAGESSAAETKEKKTAGALKEGGDLKIAIPQFQKTFLCRSQLPLVTGLQQNRFWSS